MTKPIFQVRVVCRSDKHGAGIPQRFYLGDRPIEVAAVVDRWPGRDHTYFKVRCPAGDLYILRHDEVTQRWELVLFESRDHDPNGPASFR